MKIFNSIALCLFSTILFAGKKVEVNKSQDFPKGMSSVALMTPTCPANFDSEWLEEKFVKYLVSEFHLAVVPASVVRKAMFDMGIQAVTDQNRAELAKRLKVDAFVVPVINDSGSKSDGVMIFNTAPGIFTATQDKVNQGKVTLLIVDGASGKMLMQGTGHGESEFRSGKGVAWKIFKEILDEAFNKD